MTGGLHMKCHNGAHGYGRIPATEAGGQSTQLEREHFGGVGPVERRAPFVVLCLVFLGTGHVACIAIGQADRDRAFDAVGRAHEEGFPDQSAHLGRWLNRN